MEKALCKVVKIRIGSELKECKIYKACRLFRYYRKYKWVYSDEEE